MKDKSLFTQNIKPEEIPEHYKFYFELKLHSKKGKKYSVIRIIRFDVSVLTKLPIKNLFYKFWEIVTPFWKKYAKGFYDYFKKEFIDNEERSGWRYYLSNSLPKTNNALEGYNRTLKDLINRKKKPFQEYLDHMIKEVISRSKQALKNLPDSPSIPNAFYILSQVLSDNIQRHFVLFEDKYYVKDSTVLCNMFNRKKTGLISPMDKLKKKIISGCKKSQKEFLKLFVKPPLSQVEQLLNETSTDKKEFLGTANIRQIIIMPDEGQVPLRRATCSCPNFGETGFCLHSLALLLDLKILNSKQLIKKKKRGRKPKISSALEVDVVSEDEFNSAND